MECEGFHAVKGDVLYDRATKGGRNMVIVLQKGIPEKEKQDLKSFLIRNNFKVNEITGEEDTILGAVGRLSIDPREVEILPGVERVIPISKPYKMASREYKKENTVVEVKNNRGQIVRIGGNNR